MPKKGYVPTPETVARLKAAWDRRRVDPHNRFLERVAGNGDCWEWAGHRDKNGYGTFWFNGTTVRAHRVSYEWWVGPLVDGLEVCHRCDNPWCVRPDHLFLGSRQENALDASRKGRLPSGKDHWMRRYPERIARGERHGAHTHPERFGRRAA